MKPDPAEHVEQPSSQLHPVSLDHRIFVMFLSMHAGLVTLLWTHTRISIFKVLGIPLDQEASLGKIGSFVIVLVVWSLLFILQQSGLTPVMKLLYFSVSSIGLVIACLLLVPIKWYGILLYAAFWAVVGLIYSQLERWWKTRKQSV